MSGPAAGTRSSVDGAVVAVLYGGTSSEAEVSRVTGRAVCEALELAAGLGRGPSRVLRVDLEEPDRWNVDGARLGLAGFVERMREVDACFLALHGGDGEDGHVQGLLAMAGVPFTGSDLDAASLSMDKWHTRLVVGAAGLRVSEGVLLSRGEEHGGLAPAVELLARHPAGVCVKPRRGGSSVGVAHALDEVALRGAAEAILAWGDEALVEAWTEGVELACGVLGNRDEPPRSLPPVEIRPHEGRFFDYEEKYSEAGATELCPPESVGPEACRHLERLALVAHHALGCDGYSRCDFIVPRTASGASGDTPEPVFLELNSLPGLTPRSLLPLAAAEAGIEFPSLCTRILESCLSRRGRRG